MPTDTQRFNWLLFDADNTLLDFSSASKDSLQLSLSQHHIVLDAEIYQIYQQVNKQVWDDFEKGAVDALRLRSLRFELLFREIGESSISPVEFGRLYLQNLVQCSEAYMGVHELLMDLKKKFRLTIVTNGLKEVQRPRLNKLNMTHYFDSIIVSDEIGVAKPDQAFFSHAYDSIPNPPPKEEILMIGDSLNSDIFGGLQFGLKTCWVSHGKANDSEVEADYQIQHIGEFSELLATFS